MTIPRESKETVAFVDNYCSAYEHLFHDVSGYEAFKYLHVGMISPIKRKTLSAIARAVGLKDAQRLHHFLSNSPWDIEAVRDQRLAIIRHYLSGQEFVLVIDETGDRKKGKKTDYVSRQYIGNLGKVEKGIVSVNAYGIIGDQTLPLMFKVFKPERRLQQGDEHKSKPTLAIEIIKTLQGMGFKFKLVLADSLYGESTRFKELFQFTNAFTGWIPGNPHRFFLHPI
ncbi:putative transposase (plasmid) [Thalassoporum mexicanum PCC 7367]|nr:IS701 family transposase [Pseudanabaena sp. PCC 7367]AFY72089.1 putative transposase [Pseudanabaena sp. PCC 7367]